jgi:hypothetical protein
MYFDAMLYLAKGGTQQLVFRLPCSLADVKTVAPCCSPDVIATPLSKNAVLSDICLDEEGGASKSEGKDQL